MPGSGAARRSFATAMPFSAASTSLIRDRYPELMAELLAEGTRLFGFEDGLPPALAAGLPPRGRATRT